jgi:predicted DNA-binding protein
MRKVRTILPRAPKQHPVACIRIPLKLRKVIDIAAKRAGKTRSQMIREALERHYL